MKTSEVKKYEFIGLPIEIIDSKNSTLIGFKGIIVDETKNTFKIDCKGKEKILLKEQITFKIKIKDKTIKINGKILVKRPEERIKK